MNSRIFTFLFLLCLANVAIAQDHVCGVTHDDQAEMISFIENFNKTSNQGSRSIDPFYVPLKFHMVANNDGTGRVKAASVLNQMSELIDAYKELGMYVYLEMDDSDPNTTFNYLNNTSIYNKPGNFVNTIIGQKDGTAANIFITENANPPGSDDDAGVVLGFYSPNGDYIIIRNADVLQATSSLTHELGHLFSLPHTFFGWENVYAHFGWASSSGVGAWDVNQFNGMYNSATAGGSNVLAELMDGSNCTIAADRICDTPPDYNFGFGAGGCVWNNTLKDLNGDIIDPMENNIMSYFSNCAKYQFTEGQVAVMSANFNSDEREYLQSDYIPDTTEIISNHEILTPTNGSTLDFNNDILLDWSDADGATNYLVSVNTSTQEFYEYFVTESEFRFDQLEPGVLYFCDVQPFNDGFTKADKKSTFFTAGDLTSVNESSFIQNVNVFPNPSNAGQEINVAISMEKTMNVSISLIDITGKTVISEAQSLKQGNNTINLDAIANKGIYILKLDTEDGSIHKRIVVQ